MKDGRIILRGGGPERAGPVLYWMDRDMRLQANWALLHARDLARARKVPLIIAYNLVTGFLGGGLRQWSFKLGALRQLCADARKLGIPFLVLLDETGEQSPDLLTQLVDERGVGTVITDFSPLHIQRRWKEMLSKSLPCPLIEVDAHNIVPVTIASPKLEFAAYTIRPKIHRLLGAYLDSFTPLGKQAWPEGFADGEPDWRKLAANPNVDRAVSEADWLKPGERAAQAALDVFLEERLPHYAARRNDPLADGQSGLSPFLHYGMISAQQVAMAVLAHCGAPADEVMHAVKNKAKVEEGTPLGPIDHAAAFLEELVVRRELSDNFCFYNPHYDSPEGFADWAKKSHAAHRKDRRDYLYTREQFDRAETHDDLWNAAQREMTETGKMHGYMRMYWAKKILEWTRSPEEAMATAIWLNDRYELDGHDPNGYAGIAWSIGGVHDRAWFTRPVYGQIRYMARSGCDRKFDTKAYIAKFGAGAPHQASLF